jgi:diguanylate cyclase (GGDEF)-like protein
MRSANEAAHDQSLVKQRTAVTLTITLIGAALLFFIGYGGVLMNRAAFASQEQLIQTALTEKVNRTLMEQKGLVLWDEGAKAAQSPRFDADWFDQEIGAFLTEGYGHDQILVLDPSDRIVYGYAHGERMARPALDPAMQQRIAPMIRQMRTGKKSGYRERDRAFALDQLRYNKLQGARSARWAANILDGPDGPVIVSMMTVIPTVDLSLMLDRPFVVISIVRLDREWFDLIGHSLQLKGLRLLGAADRDAESVPVIADNGQTTGRLAWQIRKPGRLLLQSVLPLFALFLLAATLFTRKIFRSLAKTQARLREQEANARFMAMHDGLSQLPNRRHFVQSLRERLEGASRDGTAPRLCVAYVDVDRFKDINDAIGHSAGDLLVTQIGPRLLAVLRHDDLLARLGGDEFAILRELRCDEEPEALGRSIMSAFKRSFEINGSQIEVTASVGLAVAARGETDPERVVQDADISLYQAKDQGRNQCIIFHAAMAEEVRVRHELESELRLAIGSGQIRMHYQPIVSARTGEVSSVEALVRWMHPERGMIAPDRFISLAERSGLMVPLGDHILETVLRDAHRFGELEIAINLSPVQLRQRTLPRRMRQLCHRFGVDPGRITLEVTESMLVESSGVCGEVFHDLLEQGFCTALDDFGTGYSSLGYLHRFRFDKIKIDRSFVSSGSLARMQPIVEAIVHIGRGLRMEIIAEGVECPAEMAMVQALGCTQVQGYGISKPLPIDEMIAFIDRSRTTPLAGVGPASRIQLAG